MSKIKIELSEEQLLQLHRLYRSYREICELAGSRAEMLIKGLVANLPDEARRDILSHLPDIVQNLQAPRNEPLGWLINEVMHEQGYRFVTEFNIDTNMRTTRIAHIKDLPEDSQ